MDEQFFPDRTRRAGINSYPIRLADGNFWGLALPQNRLRLKVVSGLDALGRPTETIHLVTEFGYSLEIRRLIDDLRDACEQGDADSQHERLFCLVASLVRLAHDLKLAEIVRLLEIDCGDLADFVETVLSVVTGDCFASNDSSRKRQADG